VKNWQEALDKSFVVSSLAKGWFMIKFDKIETVEWVLGRNWCFGRHPILFKIWNPMLDA